MEGKDIVIPDLKQVEEELSKDELISVLFILYVNHPHELLNINLNSVVKGNNLEHFAQFYDNWKTLIIEALTITGLFEVINKLGISSAEAREHLSRSSIINSNVRNLFDLCEACDESTTKKFIDYIKQMCVVTKEISSDMLEVYLAKCLDDRHMTHEFLLNLIREFFVDNKNDKISKIVDKFPNFNETKNATTNSLNSYKSEKMKVLIINQEHFHNETDSKFQEFKPGENLKERKGTQKDVAALQNLFEKWKYDVTVKNDLKHDMIVYEIRKVVESTISYNGLIVCVLSHGHEGVIYGCNSIPVQIKEIKREMESKLLIGKPKILLIQACQGNNLQQSQRNLYGNVEFDGPASSREYGRGSVYADFLTFWSTIAGFASVRNREEGTWFIQELVNEITSLHETNHLMDICTAVIDKVYKKSAPGNEIMLPKLETTFVKNFYFPKTKQL